MEFRCKELERKATGLSKITIKQGIEAKGIDEIKKFIKSQEPIMKKELLSLQKSVQYQQDRIRKQQAKVHDCKYDYEEVRDVYEAKRDRKNILVDTLSNLKSDVYRRKQQYKMIQLCKNFSYQRRIQQS